MDNNLNQNNLDFEKMNEKLADPNFANWYYHEVENSENKEFNISNFVEIINSYDQNQYE